MDLFFVALFGSLGALSRYFIYNFEKSLPSHSFPLGTLLINSLGCLVLGMLLSFAEKAEPSPRHLMTLFSLGFIGSFTTFSAFSGETLSLLKNNLIQQAAWNVLSNICLGLLMVWLGSALVSYLRGI